MPEKSIQRISPNGFLVVLIPIAAGIAVVRLVADYWQYVLTAVIISVAFLVWQNIKWVEQKQQINPIFSQLIIDNQGAITPLDLAMKANIDGNKASRFLQEKTKEFGAGIRQTKDGIPVYYFLTVSTLGSIFDDSEPEEEFITQEVSINTTIKPSSNSPLIAESVVSAEAINNLIPEKVTQHLVTIDDSPPPIIKESIIDPSIDDSSPAIIDKISVDSPTEDQSLVINSSGSVRITIIQSELAKRLDVSSSTVYKRRDDQDFSQWSQSRDPDGLAWFYAKDTKEFYRLE